VSPARVKSLAAVLAFAISSAAPASAQQGNGFLFGEPSGSFSFRGGWAVPSAGSDLFGLATSQFTLDRSQFRSPDASMELALRVKPQLDIVLNAAISGVSKRSESRNYIGSDGLPIFQTTNFQRLPVSVSARYYLQPRGRSVGRFAWVPARYATYVGAGVGMMNYEFEQSGEFVDSTTKNIFPDHFRSDGWTPMAQALAGVEWSLGPRWALTTEAKYVSAGTTVRGDFDGYRLDLSGFSTSVGFSVRF
jgi:hypothetical protein